MVPSELVCVLPLNMEFAEIEFITRSAERYPTIYTISTEHIRQRTTYRYTVRKPGIREKHHDDSNIATKRISVGPPLKTGVLRFNICSNRRDERN